VLLDLDLIQIRAAAKVTPARGDAGEG